MCQDVFYVHSQETNETIDLNTLAVKGIASIGGGYSNLEEFLGCLDIPCMAEGTYQNRHETVARAWEQTAMIQMKAAAEEEIQHAKKTGSVDNNGVPLVEVVVDGAWSKRSYRTKYNALSGVATIIGNHTGKVLYVGVKNKYCVHCDRGETKKSPHICTKFFSGSSTSMESEILVQGFKSSLAMYGIKYHRLIGDGDSSVYSKIVEARPYVDTTVEKIECRNHLVRNYSAKLKDLTTNTKFSCKERKLLESRLLRLRSGVKGAIQHNKQVANSIKNLREDILNGGAHVFGCHSKCREYFCNKPDEDNIFETLSPVFKTKIMEIIRRLANHARSLLHDVDSNVVEHYNSIVAKFIGGKRINYAFKNSYSARCYAAVVSHNTSMAHTFFKKVLLPHSKHGQIISRIESRRKMKCSRRKTMTKRKTFAPKTSKMNTRQPDKDYGYECQKADMDPETFQFAAAEFLENLQRSEQEKIQLEEKTRLQDENGLWMEERRKLVTASNFAKICKRKKNRDTSKLVQNILYSSRNLGNIASIRHGKEHEDEVIIVLENVEKIKIKKCVILLIRDTHSLVHRPMD